MSSYKFYYDESEHSRKINYETVSASNYYDNFIPAILGWEEENEKAVFEQFSKFEEKYADRKDSSGEIKSTTLKQKGFNFGFASLNKQNVELVSDYLDILDERVYIYFSVASKIEYLILQMFFNYENSFLIDADLMKYSIIKALVVYRPKEVIKCIYDCPEKFVEQLKVFFRKRIECNKSNLDLKAQENAAFEQILSFLDEIYFVPELTWDYHAPFVGFNNYLNEMGISDYFLLIDKEGKENEPSNTLKAAREIGLLSSDETNSIKSKGLQMADLLAGIIAKLLKALNDALTYETPEKGTTKKTLDEKWFRLSDTQLLLYKKLYRIVCETNNAWYKTYAGIYSDDLVTFIALLQYINHFESAKQILDDIKMQPEYFNAFVCEELSGYFERRKHKLPIEPIGKTDKDYFLNNRGAKVYFDINKQPVYAISEGSNMVEVLSIGTSQNGNPLITILQNKKAVCYRLPEALSDWAITAIGMADCGEKLFPSKVIFSKIGDKYYADIL